MNKTVNLNDPHPSEIVCSFFSVFVVLEIVCNYQM